MITLWFLDRSVKKMFSFSGTKRNACCLEPVIIHDILSNDTLEIRDSESLEITAMIHGGKVEEGDRLNSITELGLEDNSDREGLGVKLKDCMKEQGMYGTFPRNGAERCCETDQKCEGKAPEVEEAEREVQ